MCVCAHSGCWSISLPSCSSVTSFLLDKVSQLSPGLILIGLGGGRGGRGDPSFDDPHALPVALCLQGAQTGRPPFTASEVRMDRKAGAADEDFFTQDNPREPFFLTGQSSVN